MRGLRWGAPCSLEMLQGFPVYRGLALQPAQNVGGLNVLGALDLFTSPMDADLKLRFKRNREN